MHMHCDFKWYGFKYKSMHIIQDGKYVPYCKQLWLGFLYFSW